MSRTNICTAIVLRAIDIGEADRFYILLTREKGRIAARGRSVRKPKSRIGALLTGHQSVLQLSEHKSGLYIERVVEHQCTVESTNMYAFMQLQHASELLLHLLHDNEPIPEIFDLMSSFLPLCKEESIDSMPAFTLRLLHILGCLPAHEDDARFKALSTTDQHTIQLCTDPYGWLKATTVPTSKDVHTFLQVVLAEQLSAPLKGTQCLSVATAPVDSEEVYVENVV